jgi:hydrogenase small subunit
VEAFFFRNRKHYDVVHGATMAFATHKGAVTEGDVVWIAAGPGCDGDTIAVTTATQPTIEDVILGQIPWIP